MSAPEPDELTRRSFVGAAGAMGLLALVPEPRLRSLLGSTSAAGGAGRFLTANEMTLLRAVIDRLIPGQPEDSTPGALQAGVPGAIDLLLGAFAVTPPLIHAGGPFSNRAGSHRDDFAHFIAMDHQAELAWRIRLEGSRGMRSREFAGPVVGLQEIYRSGLAYVDELSHRRYGVGFAAAATADRDALLSETADHRLQSFLSAVLANTLEAMYGPPEYGGNRGLVGWTSNGWRGDTQPSGWPDARVREPDTAGSSPDAAAAARALRGPLPDLLPRSAPRDQPWLRRGGLGRR